MLRGFLLPHPTAIRARRSRATTAFFAIISLFAAYIVLGAATPSNAADPCGTGSNPIVCENSKPGTPRSQWDIGAWAGSDNLQGFSTSVSVQPGGTIQFKIDSTDLTNYSIEIYRTGWYGGDGARLIDTISPSVKLPQTQPACIYDDDLEETDCGNWAVSASWSVPTTAVSGVYIADLWDPDTNDASQITFVVTDPTSHSDILLKTSDATWQAYNSYGGADFYQGGDNGRAYAVSYNRPIVTRGSYYSGGDGRDFYFNSEYPLVEFLEENGYDVSYTTDTDTAVESPSVIEQHKVFISSGHDEYWSTQERANVETARDAGVNMQFDSGNEVYWHTRLTPSIDGSNTPNRTITSYKETWSNAKIDPSTTWTGTWRDPRFASAANGGSDPEESLTGTMYMNNATDNPVTVTAAQGAGALWANTGLSSMSGSSTALAPHTVGYESDEDVDNGFRQSGLIYLSTTTATTSQELQDFGSVTATGTTTNHMTLYRASSGALVFSAGSIQWNWGLNATHDGDGAAADPRMQQFEVNLLAMMGVQPQTLMSGLVPGAGHTDTTPPVATVTSPAPGSSIASGSSVTVSGTASDVGGAVAAVEISVDGGETWHMATGTTSWSYTYLQHGIGQTKVLVRAVDDSANYAATPVSATYNVTGPFTILGNATPAVTDAGDPSQVELGLKFTAAQSGQITGVRFYKSAANTGTHVGHLWDVNGNLLASVTFSGETSSGWQTASFATPVSVTSGQSYVVSYSTTAGHYAADAEAFAYRGLDQGPLTVAGGFGATAGVFGVPGSYPASTYEATNYYVDAIFATGGSTPPLTASGQWPASGATGVATGSAISAVFSAPVTASSVSFHVVDQNGTAVAGATSYNASTMTATFTPSSALNGFVQYSVTLTATSTAGATLSSGGSWAFTTAKTDPNVCPCTLYSPGDQPVELQDADTNAVTLGVRFTPSADGTVSGVSFYKGPNNTGTHTGSLWTATGTKLATGTFSGESASGWQTLTFSSPVAVSAGTQYVAAYRTTVGSYSVDPNAFPLTAGPLSADSGMYSYADAFPGTTSTASYLVDVVYQKSPAVLSVTAETPSSGAVNVPTSTSISLTASSALASGYSVSVKNGQAAVNGATALSADGKTLTFTPSSTLPTGASISVSVSGLASTSGATVPTQSWTFSTASADAPPSYTLFGNATPADAAPSNDPSPVEVGTTFSTSQSGTVTGIRFYKGTSNTGTHVGHLWSSSGVLLASVTFTGESVSGWQTASLSTPVAITAGTNYVVSYFAPNGNYSYATNYFSSPLTNGPLTAPASNNGLYLYSSSGGMPQYSWQASNYFVDVVFQPAASTSTPTPTPTPTANPLPSGAETLFATNATPANTDWQDGASVQVGVSFTASVGGQISGIRYYRAPHDTAADTVYLWSASGTKLASASVPSATASGWQYIPFSTPVTITAATQYRASYYTTSERYAVDPNALSSSVSNGKHLTALGGVWSYDTAAPANQVTHNYWVDVAFTPSS